MNRKGFTLVELLATLVILGIVVGLGIVISGNVFGGAKEKTEGVFIKLASPEFLLKDRFLVTDIPALDNILETDGIKVVGVLGSTFLKKNYLVIDYDALALSMYKK